MKSLKITVLLFPLAIAINARAQNSAPTNLPEAKASPSPTADQIIDRYLQAEGGRAAFEKLTSRVMKGKLDVPSMSWSGTFEIREKAPNRSLEILTVNGAAFRQGFDGTAGWTDDPQYGLRDQAGAELAETRRESDFYHTINLRKLYSQFTFVGKDTVDDRDAYVVEATVPEGGPPEKMYFDVQSGLLLRDISLRHGPGEPSQYQQDYEDYRDVDGIQLPHTIRHTSEGTLVIITVEEYHHNVPIDDAEFAKPAAE